MSRRTGKELPAAALLVRCAPGEHPGTSPRGAAAPPELGEELGSEVMSKASRAVVHLSRLELAREEQRGARVMRGDRGAPAGH